MDTDAAKLPSDTKTLQAMVVQSNAMIREHVVTIQELTTKLAKLEHYIEQLVRARYGPRGEQLDPNQLTLFDTAAQEQQQPGSQPARPTVRVKEHQRHGGGRQELPDSLERKVIEHDLAESEKQCPGCGGERTRIGCEESEQLEYEPAKLFVLVHRRWKYACRPCGEHVATAPPAAKPIEKGLPGPGLLAAVVTGKYADHLPLYRLEDVFFRSGVELSRSTLCRWALQTAELLRPLYELMVREVLQSRVIHTDDTPMPVLDPELDHTRTARLWTYIGDWRHPLTVYDYTTSRKRDGPQQFLNGYAGYLQADAYGGYDGIYAGGLVKQVLCWAHARRKFYEARTVQPDEAHAALAFIARLYAVEDKIARFHTDFQQSMDVVQIIRRIHRERRRVRQKEALPILHEFHAWLDVTQHKVLPKSPIGQAIGYVLPRWEGLTRYCEDGCLAIDNNVSERMIRPCAIGRKNFLFFGSDDGGRAAAVLYSVMASAKANQVEPFAYVRDLLDTFSKAPDHDLTRLLPNAWLAAHPQDRRDWSR
jgi:transposase